MPFKFRPAVRQHTNLLLGLAGPSGAGKTLSALRLARGILGGKDDGIFFIDTEAGRAAHYACAEGEKAGEFRFQFQHCEMGPPFSPAAYREAIAAAMAAGAKVIIVDSFSHAHEGEGGMLHAHQAEMERMGNRESMKFAAWIRPKSDQGALVNFILQQKCNFIFAFRAKDKLRMVKTQKNGREVLEPVQMGWTAICPDRFEYEMTTLLMLPPTARGVPDLSLESTKINAHHVDFFPPGEPISEKSGELLAAWARGGEVAPAPMPPPAAKGKPELTTAQKVSAARDRLRLPDAQFERICTAKLSGPLADAPDGLIEADLVPFLRDLMTKKPAALDDLARIVAEVPA